MERTLATLEARLSQKLAEPLPMTTTTNGAGDGTTLISSALLMRPSASYAGYECEITSGARDGDRRMIRDFSVSGTTATLTPFNAFGGQILNGVTFRLHRAPLDIKYHALDSALRELSAIIPCEIVEDLPVGELLRNPNLEFWESLAQPFDWEIYEGTVSRESTIVFDGKYALRINGIGSLRQRIPLEKELVGLPLTLTGYIYDTVSLLWYAHEVNFIVPNDTEPLYIWLENTSGDDIICDALNLSVDDLSVAYWIPRSKAYRNLADVLYIPEAISNPTQPQISGRTLMPLNFNKDYGWYANGTPAGGHLRLVGAGGYSALSISTDSLELSENATTLLAIMAGIKVSHEMKSGQYMTDPDYWQRVEADLAAELTEGQRRLQVQAPPIRISPWRT